ncbi:hypothetical protein BGX28_004650 [Mortierella sp. GBA30]|nr:hypothetical protein BGX28_004650 [Mortierella sp. GBA30]
MDITENNTTPNNANNSGDNAMSNAAPVATSSIEDPTSPLNNAAALDKNIPSIEESLMSPPETKGTKGSTTQPDNHNPTDSDDWPLKHHLDSVMRFMASRDERERCIVATVTGLVAVRVCLPWLTWTTILGAVLGMGVGGFVVAFYLLAVPETTRIKRASTFANFGRHHHQRFEIVDGVPSWSDALEKQDSLLENRVLSTHTTNDNNVQPQRVNISPEIDPMVEEMISFTLRDFVNVPVGLVSVGQHNVPLRASLVAMWMNLSTRLSNMRLPETALLAIFGLQNNFIVHLRAYRELRASRLPIAQYVSTHANPDSVLGRCYHKEERLKQFRSTAKAVCQALLSKNDQQSVALFAVMQEIMATHVLESTLEHMCDPDFINLSIIDYFESSAKDSKKVSGAQNGSKGSSVKGAVGESGSASQTEEADISALADSILMNAAHLMDKSSLKKQDTFSEINTRLSSSSSSSTTPTPRREFPSPQLPSPSSAFDEVNAFDRFAIAEAEKASVPVTVTLKRVLIHKNEHMDLYQEFMAYLQVWDAMDLVQFWLMIDIFHRQIEQGTLLDDDLRRETNSIFESYCGPDQDQNVAGIREANGGALVKNMKKKMQHDPAHCFLEAQEWALNVLESQYWVPFEIKKQNENFAKKREILQRPESITMPPSPPSITTTTAGAITTNGSNATHGQEEGPPEIQLQAAETGSTSPLSMTIPTKNPDTPSSPSESFKAPTSPVSMPGVIVQSIDLSDMVNRRPKTLMSNADLSYMIEVQTEGGQGWMVTRTFQQIELLQQTLVQQFPVVQRTVFPRWRLQPSDKVCHGLQNFMRTMLTIPEVKESSKLAWFLSKEYDQSLQDSLAQRNRSSSVSSGLLGSTFSLGNTEQNMAAFGASAAQGAKTALRQASEASLTAGRFFKSLGAAVGASSPQLLPDDRASSRGSFESIRSVRSVNSMLTLSEQQHQQQQQPQHSHSPHANGTGSSSSLSSWTHTPRLQDAAGSETQSRMSSSSESLRVNNSRPLDGQGQSHVLPSTVHKQDSFGPNGQSLTPMNTLSGHAAGLGLQASHSIPSISHNNYTSQSLQAETLPSSPSTLIASTTFPAVQLPITATTSATSPAPVSVPSSGVSASTPVQQQQPKRTTSQKISLLSNDELDLLIETSFTVLEDMMDFSKGQSIRRMTFGMLRELVRKSYRVAINESFSAWVEQNTSHEKAAELVKWMKDDLLWPNGQWASDSATTEEPGRTSEPSTTTVTTTTTSSSSTVSSLSQQLSTPDPDEMKDIIHIGDDLYEVGSDGIAVKVDKRTLSEHAVTAGASPAQRPDSSIPATASATAHTAAIPVIRTTEEKEATREKARELVKMMLPGSLVTVLGREAVLRGLVDVFEMFQIKELNLGLALSVLEMSVRLVLTR